MWAVPTTAVKKSCNAIIVMIVPESVKKDWVPPVDELTNIKTQLESALETTRADLEEKTYQIISLEARLQAIEQKILAAN